MKAHCVRSGIRHARWLALLAVFALLPSTAAPQSLDLDSLDAINDQVLRSNIPSILSTLLRYQAEVASIYGADPGQLVTLGVQPQGSSALSLDGSPFRTYGELAAQLNAALGQSSGSLDALAVAVTSLAIAETTQFNFAQTINSQAAQNYISSLQQSGQLSTIASALYDLLFPYLTGPDGEPFNAFLASNPSQWGLRYQTYVTTGAYITRLQVESTQPTPGWMTNTQLVTYKLSLLSPADQQAVATIYQQQGLPIFTRPWGDLASASSFQANDFVGEVNAAIATPTSVSTPVYAGGGLMGMGSTIYGACTTTYGSSVVSLITGPLANLGLASGNQPSGNRTVATQAAFGPSTPCS